MAEPPLRLAALGLDHRHIYHQVGRLLDDPAIHLIVSAAVPAERAGIAMRSMRRGKDVMVDKPGVTSLLQLEEVKRVQAETGRIWSVDFSERFEVRAMTRAAELVDAGAIGEAVHLTGFGPHRLNRHLRPPWFFDPERTGGILCDLASHQIDQFLYLTRAPAHPLNRPHPPRGPRPRGTPALLRCQPGFGRLKFLYSPTIMGFL